MRFRPAAARRRVDLPHPEEPMTEIISPGAAVKETPRRTSWVPPGTGKDCPTSSKLKGTAAVDTAWWPLFSLVGASVTALLSVMSLPSFLALAPGAEESVPVAATSWSQVSQSLWMVCSSNPMGCGVPQSTLRARMNFYDSLFRIYHEIFRFYVTKRFFRHKRDLPPARPVHSNHEIMSPGAKLWLAGRQPSPVAGCPR